MELTFWSVDAMVLEKNNPEKKEGKYMRKSAADMTQGSVVRHLIMFTVPLLLGNLFQQLYNTVDAWIVGNYVGNEAFAAVGTVGAITNLLIYAFSGLCTGVGVIVSQYFGAHEEENVSKAVHTFVVFSLILCVAFSVIGFVMTPTFLRIMGSDPAVVPQSIAYLRIYFTGFSGLLLYNMASAIMRAVGDSRRPFYYLVVSTLLNIALDLFFVLKLNMGVRGVAYATVIAQGASALLALNALLRTEACVRIVPSKLRINSDFLKKILHQGLPASFQMSITSFSSIFIQSYIYQFGADVMSGWAAYSKINSIVGLPVQSMGMAASTFVGQNVGAGDVKRAKKGLATAVIMIVSVTVFFALVLIPTAPYLISFFNDKAEVVECGAYILRLMNYFFFTFGVATVTSASIRGSGKPRVPFVIMLSCYVGFRQVYMFVVSNFISNTLTALMLAIPFSYILAATACLIYLKKRGLGSGIKVKATED
jgi:putative MATE family efflux protein